MPADLTFTAASLALARAAGLTSVDLDAALRSFKEKFGTERRTRAAWESALAAWLKRQRPVRADPNNAGIDGPRHDRRGTPLDDSFIMEGFYHGDEFQKWFASSKGLATREDVFSAVDKFRRYYLTDMLGDMRLNTDWPATLLHWLKWQDALALAVKHQGVRPKRVAV